MGGKDSSRGGYRAATRLTNPLLASRFGGRPTQADLVDRYDLSPARCRGLNKITRGRSKLVNHLASQVTYRRSKLCAVINDN